MNHTEATLIGLGVLAILVIVFFLIFRGEGEFSLNTILGRVKAKGKNPPPPANVAGGVKIKDADAGRNLTAHNTGAGGVDLEKVKAKGDITATNTPGAPPPKA